MIVTNGNTYRLLTEISAIAADTEHLASKVGKGYFTDSCACGDGLTCAWHAQIAEQLGMARNILGYAMQSLERRR